MTSASMQSKTPSTPRAFPGYSAQAPMTSCHHACSGVVRRARQAPAGLRLQLARRARP